MKILQFTNTEDKIILTKKLPKCKTNEDYIKAWELRDEMIQICKDKNWSGLSSNQIWVEKKFFVIYTPKLEGLFINPTILQKDGKKRSEEWCLSFNDGRKTSKERATSISVHFQNKDKESIRMRISWYEAIVFQHEMDHMDGIVI